MLRNIEHSAIRDVENQLLDNVNIQQFKNMYPCLQD